jgi:hypothetical protein
MSRRFKILQYFLQWSRHRARFIAPTRRQGDTTTERSSLVAARGYCACFGSSLAEREWEDKNGQRVIQSAALEFELQEQKAGSEFNIACSFCAGIARGKPLRPSSPIESIAHF